MQKIVILGSGVAALTTAYHLLSVGYSVKMVSPEDTLDVPTGGSRFLHDHRSDAFDALIKSAGFSRNAVEISGGIQFIHEGLDKTYTWADLCKHKDLASDLTHVYADTTGRIWSNNILNNINNMVEPPRGLISPSYRTLIDYMLSTVKSSNKFTFISRMIHSISIDDHYIRLHDRTTIEYDKLINTIPFWVFKDLFDKYYKIDRDFQFTPIRYAQVSSTDSTDLSMTYYVGNDIQRVLGHPVKRKSIIDGKEIVEFFDKPDIRREQLTQLPPNIVDIEPDDYWISIIGHLKENDIRLLGRFAEMKSKMMFTDIIDAAATLAHNLYEEN